MVSACIRRLTVPCIEPLEARIAPAAVAAINLADLNGGNGFELRGVADSDSTGYSVSDAGDVNHDGLGDLIVGAYRAAEGGSSRGANYVVFGQAGGFASSLDLSTLDGTNGFKISGGADGDTAGFSVSAAGDVNGDSIDDVIIGTYLAPGGGTLRGASYVVFGKTGNFGASLNLSTLDGATGFTLNGVADFDQVGFSVGGAGDINGDGFDDVIIGARYADEGGSNRGAAYVVFGKGGGFDAIVALGALDGSDGFKLSGLANNNHLGTSVSSAGDVNKDGFADLVIGAPNAGAAYVVFGRADSFGSTVALDALDGTNGFKVNGAVASDPLGNSVSGAGDVNGDGFADVIIGAPFARHPMYSVTSGTSYVVFGKESGFPATTSLGSLDGTNGFRLHGTGWDDRFGVSASGAGDVNGDRIDDLIVGASFFPTPLSDRIDACYVLFGNAGGFGASMTLSSALDGTNGFKIGGGAEGDFLGLSVSGAGDVNGDGLADLIIGAPGADEGGANRGAAHVIFGFRTVDVKVAPGGKSATFIDGDGDIVTVKVSKGALSEDDFVFSGGTWQQLDLTGAPAFQGASLTISAKKPVGGTGDGKVNIGAIDASGIDLGTVSVSGDLRQIDAGDAVLTTPAIRALTVGSLGFFGPPTLVPGPLNPVQSDLTGGLGALTVKGTMRGVLLASGPIGPVTIGLDLDGSLAGAGQAGLIESDAGIGAVTVKRNILGGADLAGIIAGGKLGRVTVLDSILGEPTKRVTISAFGKSGATGANAIAIAGVSVSDFVEDARIVAGFNLTTGAVDNAGAGIGPVTIAGSLANGVIRATGAVGAVNIGRTLDGSGGGTRSGLIEGGTGVGAVTIKGSIMGGADFTGILSGGKLGKVTVGDGIVGTASKPVTIAALGKIGAKTAADAVAIAGLAVTNSVINARILAGYDVNLTALNPDAGIGAVTVGRDWTASSLVAGVKDTSSAGNLASAADGFGRNDTLIGGDTTPAIFATIASITIKGTTTGSVTPTSDHFGLTAQKILAATTGGARKLLPAGANDLLLDAANNDFRLVDFA